MEPFEAALPEADLLSLRWLRRNLAEWLEQSGVAATRRSDIVLAIHEAAANGIEHGTAGVIVRASRDQDKLVVVVTSSGRWDASATDDGPLSRLRLMRALASNVEVNVVDGRTAVRMRVELKN